MKIWYKLQDKKIKSWVKTKDGYYVIEDIKGGRNKRSIIKQVLKNSDLIISHQTNNIPYDPPIYYVYIESNALRVRMEEFKDRLDKLWESLMDILE